MVGYDQMTKVSLTRSGCPHPRTLFGFLGLQRLIAVMDAKQVAVAVEGSAGDIGAQGGASAGAG